MVDSRTLYYKDCFVRGLNSLKASAPDISLSVIYRRLSEMRDQITAHKDHAANKQFILEGFDKFVSEYGLEPSPSPTSSAPTPSPITTIQPFEPGSAMLQQNPSQYWDELANAMVAAWSIALKLPNGAIFYTGKKSIGPRRVRLFFKRDISLTKLERLEKALPELNEFGIPDGIVLEQEVGYFAALVPVPKEPDVISLADYIGQGEGPVTDYPFFLSGIDIDGKVDRRTLNRVLIAGITDSGKSSMQRSINVQLCFWYLPWRNSKGQARRPNVQFVLFDTEKGTEFSAFDFDDNPWLFTGIVKEHSAAIDALAKVLEEVSARRKRFEAVNRQLGMPSVLNTIQWNKMFPDDPMPWIVLNFEEWADLYQQQDQLFAQMMALIVRTSRDAGVLVVFGTGRPDPSVLPVQIAAHIKTRIVMQCGSRRNYAVALGMTDAGDSRAIRSIPTLMGKGECIIRSTDANKLSIVQGFLASDEIIGKIISYGRREWKKMQML